MRHCRREHGSYCGSLHRDIGALLLVRLSSLEVSFTRERENFPFCMVIFYKIANWKADPIFRFTLAHRVIILFGSQRASSGQKHRMTIPRQSMTMKGTDPFRTSVSGTSGAIP